MSWLTLIIGLGFYLYKAWYASGAAPRSAKEMAQFAGLAWLLVAGAGLFAWVWGGTHGLSAYQTFVVNSTAGKLQNWVATFYSLVVVAACFSTHALVVFLMRHGRRADIES